VVTATGPLGSDEAERLARVEALLESVSATADNEPAQGTAVVRRGERKAAEDGSLPAKTNQTAKVD
jgi:hypothetical protein